MKDFIIKIYLYSFINNLNLIGVIYTLFFKQAGLNPFQISILITIWALTTFILEIPTGTLADKFNRRNLLIIGQILKAVGFLFWLIGGFYFFALGFVLWGTRNALVSGTEEAFVYDKLKSYNRQDLYEKVYGKNKTFLYLAIMISAIIGGYIAEINFSFVLTFSILTTIISAIILLTIKPTSLTYSKSKISNLMIFRKALNQLCSNTSLLFLFMLICLIIPIYGALDEFWGLIFSNLNISLKYIGFLVALVYGTCSLAGLTVHYFKSKDNKLSFNLIAIAAILIAFFGLFNHIYFIFLVFIAIYLIQIANIKFEAQLQHAIKSDQRATIYSIKSLFYEIIYILLVLVFGFISNKFYISTILPLAGGLIIVSLVSLIFLNKIKFKTY
jgi:MFS family permease